MKRDGAEFLLPWEEGALQGGAESSTGSVCGSVLEQELALDDAAALRVLRPGPLRDLYELPPSGSTQLLCGIQLRLADFTSGDFVWLRPGDAREFRWIAQYDGQMTVEAGGPAILLTVALCGRRLYAQNARTTPEFRVLCGQEVSVVYGIPAGSY